MLVIDLDITGTNAVDVAKPDFWSKDLYPVKQVGSSGAGEAEEVNLLELFDRRFMLGEAVPRFSETRAKGKLWVDLGQVNILGSQIYDMGGSGGGRPTCIERPSVLFDDLHAFWLREFVELLVGDFGQVIRQTKRMPKPEGIAIILDSSPGYIGLSPVLRDWLTDRGPARSKFLTVLSLDAQDVRACDKATVDLHQRYVEKWELSRRVLAPPADFEVKKEQEPFFLRLVSPRPGSSRDEDPVAFYRGGEGTDQNRVGGGAYYCGRPGAYSSAVLNRVPGEVKTGAWDFAPPSDLSTKAGGLLSLLGSGGEKDDGWRVRMVPYDEYVGNQFLFGLRWPRGKPEGDAGRLARRLADVEREVVAAGSASRGYLQWPPTSPARTGGSRDLLGRMDRLLTSALAAIEMAGLEHLARLVRPEWLPGSIVRSLHTPLLELGVFSRSFASSEVVKAPRERRFSVPLRRDLEKTVAYIQTATGRTVCEEFASTLWRLGALLEAPSVWGETNGDLVRYLLQAALEVQVAHWARLEEPPRRPNLTRFLAQDTVAPDELMQVMPEPHESSYAAALDAPGPSFLVFYRACALAQARLLDLAADARFLLLLLQRAIAHSGGEQDSVVPFLRGLAEDVIVNKTAHHDVGVSEVDKALREANYYRDFDIVLTRVLADWGLDDV